MFITNDEATLALARKWGTECLVTTGPGYWMAEKQETETLFRLVASPSILTLDRMMSGLGWQPRGIADEWSRVAAIFGIRAH